MSIAIGSVTTGWSNAAMVIDSEGEDTLAMPIKKRVVINRAIGKAMHIWYTRKPNYHAIHVQNPLTDFWRGGGISLGLRWFCLCNRSNDFYQQNTHISFALQSRFSYHYEGQEQAKHRWRKAEVLQDFRW